MNSRLETNRETIKMNPKINKKTNFKIRSIENNDSFWEEIGNNSRFSLFHSQIWHDIIKEKFGYKSNYVAAYDEEHILDVIPLFLVSYPLLGKKLISTPFDTTNGSFISTNSGLRNELIREIVNRARKYNVKYVEIRSDEPIPELDENGFIKQQPFVISEVILKNVDENWYKLSANHRRNVRYASKRGISVEFAKTWDEARLFIKVLCQHYKNLGLPFLSEKFFKDLWEILVQTNKANVLIARYMGNIIGGLLIFYSGDTLIAKYGAVSSDKKLQKLYTSYALFWEALSHGIEKKFCKFNMGITSQLNTGLLEFKTRFGAENRNVYFYFYPISGKIPDYESFYNKYQFIKKMWKLTPNFITSPIGHKISSWLC